MTKDTQDISQYVATLCMNGLQGRMLRLPAPAGTERQILMVYGHHSTLERWSGLAQEANKYGAVCMPDLPGFGGMQSFCSIGEKPTLDAYADYLAAFVKLRYGKRRLTIVGMSFGFLVATRMLQRYPDLAKQVDMLVSLVGFSHHEDFVFGRRRKRLYRAIARVLSWRLSTIIFRNIALHPLLIKHAYTRGPNSKHKFSDMSSSERQRMIDAEVKLWRVNDVYTHWRTTQAMLHVDNCSGRRVDLPVWHIYAEGDQYFNHHVTEQHLRVIFSDYHESIAHLKNHAPSVIADAEEAAAFIPEEVREALSKATA